LAAQWYSRQLASSPAQLAIQASLVGLVAPHNGGRRGDCNPTPGSAQLPICTAGQTRALGLAAADSALGLSPSVAAAAAAGSFPPPLLSLACSLWLQNAWVLPILFV